MAQCVIEVYRTSRLRGGRWRWRVRADNGQVTGASAQGFRDQVDARRAAVAFASAMRGDCPIVVV